MRELSETCEMELTMTERNLPGCSSRRRVKHEDNEATMRIRYHVFQEHVSHAEVLRSPLGFMSVMVRIGKQHQNIQEEI